MSITNANCRRAVRELDGQPWAGAMREFLKTADQTVLSAVAAGQDRSPAKQLTDFKAPRPA